MHAFFKVGWNEGGINGLAVGATMRMDEKDDVVQFGLGEIVLDLEEGRSLCMCMCMCVCKSLEANLSPRKGHRAQ